MIAHVSLPADDPALVARVLAEIMSGAALPFPPGGPDAYNCWSSRNEYQIVVTPRGRVLVPGPEEQAWASRVTERASECHVAIAVERSAEEVIALARAAGWLARRCARGTFFEAVEVWVENTYLVEVLDPTQRAEYERNMNADHWRRAFGLDPMHDPRAPRGSL